MLKRSIVLTSIFLFFFCGFSVVSAQEESVDQVEPTTQAQTVSAAELKTQAQASYRANLEAYRNDLRQYTISKTQFTQLQTLAALEDAIAATRKVMLSRATVLEVYIQLLQLELQQVQSFPEELKQEKMTALQSLRDELTAHKELVTNTSDRAGIAQRAEEFVDLSANSTQLAYDVLSRIKLAKIKTVYLLSLEFTDEISTVVAERFSSYPNTVAEKNRGIEQIRSVLTISDQQFLAADEIVNREKVVPDSSTLDDVKTKLLPVYTSLSQVLNYMAEVLDTTL